MCPTQTCICPMLSDPLLQLPGQKHTQSPCHLDTDRDLISFQGNTNEKKCLFVISNKAQRIRQPSTMAICLPYCYRGQHSPCSHHSHRCAWRPFTTTTGRPPSLVRTAMKVHASLDRHWCELIRVKPWVTGLNGWVRGHQMEDQISHTQVITFIHCVVTFYSVAVCLLQHWHVWRL